MKRMMLVALVMASMLLASLLTLWVKASSAAPRSLAQVIPFVTDAGYIGLLDQAQGKVYFYDGLMKKCVYIVEISEPGQPGNPLFSDF